MPSVVICDDSRSVREVLARILTTDDHFEVVGLASDGEEALRMVRDHAPDLLTLDINLPGLSGLEVIDELMADAPLPILVLSDQGGDSNLVMEALAGGAVEVSTKPALGGPDFEAKCAEILELAKTAARARVIRHLRGRKSIDGERSSLPPTPAAPPPAPERDRSSLPPSREIGVVAIAASTGGPQALKEIVDALPEDFSTPILVVQHIAKGFTEGLVEWLGHTSKLPVCMAEEGAILDAGKILIAPEGYHLRVSGKRIELDESDPVGGHRPSADVLFESLASSFGKSVLAVILTGMGRDGVRGLAAVHAAGGRTIVQDEATSAVYGMPKAAVDAGVADEIRPLAEISQVIERYAGKVATPAP